jgi:hypothetical protein
MGPLDNLKELAKDLVVEKLGFWNNKSGNQARLTQF